MNKLCEYMIAAEAKNIGKLFMGLEDKIFEQRLIDEGNKAVEELAKKWDAKSATRSFVCVARWRVRRAMMLLCDATSEAG